LPLSHAIRWDCKRARSGHQAEHNSDGVSEFFYNLN
jgi:hypothetical protein